MEATRLFEGNNLVLGPISRPTFTKEIHKIARHFSSSVIMNDVNEMSNFVPLILT